MTVVYVRGTGMGTQVAACKVLQFAVRKVTSSGFGPLQFGRCHLQPLCTECRLFCSSTSQSTFHSTPQSHELRPLSRKPATELSLRSLVDMGFTHSQAEHINDAMSKLRGGSATKHALSALTALFALGFNPSSMLKLLEKCPELYTVKESQLQQRIGNLRKLGLVEGCLQRVVSHYPHILTVSVKAIKHVVVFLREKCLFTAQQVTDILRDSPAIVMENMGQLEYKFQYVYFRMGVKQQEMVKSRLFRFTLDEVRCRHCFLERRGLYQTPDKKGQTLVLNPKLDSILSVDQDTFLAHVANASTEEYDVFKRMMAQEWHEEQQQWGSIEVDSNDDDDDDDYMDEEEEETRGKSGYRKSRKK
ncbi:transcription termination factor 4, mitochondrial [Etheostoma cragini]|uniref:transcription termination factor 4, mitochondrial n=1 Tax=Etheostoma cragini TaxID=417921 RepID=UPI00155ECCEA|nr:transcription termination factor 4, mitochondrial [Etheostoma cragini]